MFAAPCRVVLPVPDANGACHADDEAGKRVRDDVEAVPAATKRRKPGAPEADAAAGDIRDAVRRQPLAWSFMWRLCGVLGAGLTCRVGLVVGVYAL